MNQYERIGLMMIFRPPRQLAYYLQATGDTEALDYSSDSFHPLPALLQNLSTFPELQQAFAAAPTSWLSMAAEERARIRPVHRSHLRSVPEITAEASDNEESA